jgi:predicted transcriptional regulator
MKSPKLELIDLLERMPDDASLDAMVAEVLFKASVLRGLAEADRGEGMSHEEVKERLSAWRMSHGNPRPLGT